MCILGGSTQKVRVTYTKRKPNREDVVSSEKFVLFFKGQSVFIIVFKSTQYYPWKSLSSLYHFILSSSVPGCCLGLGVIVSPGQTDSEGHYHYNGIFTNFLPHFYGPITDYLTTTNIPLSCCCIGQWDKIWPKIFLWIKMVHALFFIL